MKLFSTGEIKSWHELHIIIWSGRKNSFFEALIKETEKFRYQKGFGHGLSSEEIEDATMESIINLLDMVDKKERSGVGGSINKSITAYFAKIYYHELLQLLRKRKKESTTSMEEFSDRLIHNMSGEEQRKKEDAELTKERTKQILSVLHRLNSREQKIFMMKSFEEKSYKEIADIIGTTEKSIKTEWARIKKKIINFLKK